MAVVDEVEEADKRLEMNDLRCSIASVTTLGSGVAPSNTNDKRSEDVLLNEETSPNKENEKWGGKLSDKKVSLDLQTRWNSTYEMLHNALEMKIAFERLAKLDNNFNTLPTEEKCEKCQKIEQCLEEKSKDDCISSMAITMRLKYEKYWKGFNLFMALGAILDPRYKMTLIRFCMRKIWGNYDAGHYISQIKFDVTDLYAKYVNKYGSSCIQYVGDIFENVDNCKEFCDGISKRKKIYNDDFKKYWTTNGPKFPILSRMARDILVVPASSVVSESVFSVGGRYITESRSSLLSEVDEVFIA
ncbi:zinc finger BED domain-containing protein RICESLEEPER 4-like [Telopea speciosissima]|uniref:zinc finger BED domain-containing protein RICESLEEPER 4-like n=1 Tax=Telopea speciosissima TaxID=54955 RepID=UPI001CC3A68A|nr:zinc finger BED domain-containing protein RICESLEEPER 4-like [Telopea speciosissima]